MHLHITPFPAESRLFNAKTFRVRPLTHLLADAACSTARQGYR